MAIVRVPGDGNYFYDTTAQVAWRQGREGGIRNPATNQLNSVQHISEMDPGSQALLRSLGQPAPAPHMEAGPDFSALFESLAQGSEEADRAMRIQTGIMVKQFQMQEKLFGYQERQLQLQEEAEREFERIVGMKRSTYEAERAKSYGEVEALQLDRLKKALKGELPVDPATERELVRREAIETEAVQRELGPTGQNSSAGIARLQAARESSDIIRDQSRRGEITGAVSPLIGVGGAFNQLSYLPGTIANGINTNTGASATASNIIEQDRANRALMGNIGLALLGQYNQNVASMQAREDRSVYDYMSGVQNVRSGGSGGGFGWEDAASIAAPILIGGAMAAFGL